MFIRRIWKEAFALEDLVSLSQSQSSQRDQSTERGQVRPLRISVEPLAAVVTSPSMTTTVTVEVNTPQTEEVPPPVPSSRPPDEEEWEPLPGDASEDETEREGGKLDRKSERVDTTFKPLVTFKDDGDLGKEKDTKKAKRRTKKRMENGEAKEMARGKTQEQLRREACNIDVGRVPNKDHRSNKLAPIQILIIGTVEFLFQIQFFDKLGCYPEILDLDS